MAERLVSCISTQSVAFRLKHRNRNRNRLHTLSHMDSGTRTRHGNYHRVSDLGNASRRRVGDP